jgi:chromosome segregation ATPase
MVVRIAAFSSSDALDSFDSTLPSLRFSRALEQAPQSLTLTVETRVHSPIEGPLFDASTAVTSRTEIESFKIELEKLRKENTSLRKPDIRGASLKNEVEELRKEQAKEKEAVKKELVAVLEQLTAQEKETNDANARILVLEEGCEEKYYKLSDVKKGSTDSMVRITFLEKEASELKTKLSTKEIEVAEAKAHLNSNDKETADRKARLAIKEQEAATAEAKLKIQGKELARLKSKLAAKDKELDKKPLEKSIQFHELEKESLRMQITTLDCALQELRQQCKDEFDSNNLKAAAELEKTQKDAKEHVEKSQAKFKKKADEISQEFDIMMKQSSMEERELRDRVELLEAGASTKKEEYERKLQKVSKDHTMQLDELIVQLDLLEAEHNQKIVETEKVMNEKDTFIAALGVQLADTRTREQEVDATHKKLLVDLPPLQEEAAEAKEDVKMLKRELETSKASHDNFVMGEVERRERACDEAREEMIERAEIQFKAANAIYIKLKKEHDSTTGMVESLERELKSVKTKLESARNEKEDALADLKVDIAELEPANARLESDAAQRAKGYRIEIENQLKATKDFESRLEVAESTSRSLERSLPEVAAAKTKLQQEYDEMKNVCEELLAIVEGQQGAA